MVYRFYVYEIVGADGSIQYVGKGSKGRLRAQERRFGMGGRIFWRYRSERDACKAEIVRIAEVQPPLNKCLGGNGSRAIPIRTVVLP